MNQDSTVFPLYFKLTQILLGLIAFFFILFIGRDIMVPLVFATLFAILLNPLVNYLSRFRINRVISILIVVLFSLFFVSALAYFIGSQISRFSESFPQLQDKLTLLFNNLVEWLSGYLNMDQGKIKDWFTKTKNEGMNNSGALISATLGTLSSVLISVFLLPVYVFFILLYKPLILEFISELFKWNKQAVVAEVLVETKGLIQNYLVGLLLEAAIVATLNSIGLMIIGINYAILLGIVGALLNVIPYIGGLIAISLPILVALATKTPISALWVIVVYLIVQFIDNNFLVPKVVASKVKINALVSIIVVLIGGALWGVPGMFLSIPMTAIVKVIFDRVEPLKPFGLLLGDNLPETGKVIFRFKKPASKNTVP